jgi:Arc/MetJ-type ribon-helix-helix transcriptional regulator
VLARDAVAIEAKRGVQARGPAAQRVYSLTLASELLDKARQQAAKGHFQSAADLAREARQVVQQADVRGDDA